MTVFVEALAEAPCAFVTVLVQGSNNHYHGQDTTQIVSSSELYFVGAMHVGVVF